MNRRSQSEDTSPQTFSRMGWRMIAALSIVVAAGFPAQAQPAGSLADVARQARAQKQSQPAAEKSQAQQVADQLAEDQDDGNSPAGFKTYNAGDYKLWVPAPYKVDGHDDGGIVLSDGMLGSKQSVVLVGNPIVLQWGNNDDAFLDVATQFSHIYSQSASCTKTTLANHAAYQCLLAGANLLGRSVSGHAIFVRGSTEIIPVFCVAPTASQARDILNDPRASYQAKRDARFTLDQEEQGARDIWKKCETVFQSIHLNEGPGRHAESSNAAAAAKPAATPAAAPERAPAPAASAAATGTIGGPASLGDIARRIHQAPAPATVAPSAPSGNTGAENPVPAGFKVQAFNYCKSSKECWNASVVVPEAAQLVSSDCKQYIFEVKVQGSPLLLLAGSGGCDGRGASAPTSPVHWNLLTDPETKRAPGTFVTISSQQAKLDSQSAIITTMGFKKGLADWMGKRAEVDANGVQVVVGCMAPREHFTDGDAICSALIDSLRLP
jgi:hypothetical protein